jgi:hypothetical protein
VRHSPVVVYAPRGPVRGRTVFLTGPSRHRRHHHHRAGAHSHRGKWLISRAGCTAPALLAAELRAN